MKSLPKPGQPQSPLPSPPPCYLPGWPSPLTLYLAAPRGFCAGVDRAIQIVELALEKWGAPVYVRHEIVHNRFVVDGLKAKGAVFVEELDECPPDRPVVFSAHGVPKSVPAEAEARRMLYLDATCPLVSKVHVEAGAPPRERPADRADRPRRPPGGRSAPWASCRRGAVLLVETAGGRRAGSRPRDPARLAYVTQTTLSVDDTAEIVAALQRALPGDRRAAQGRHLLRHHQPPGGGQGDGAEDRGAAW